MEKNTLHITLVLFVFTCFFCCCSCNSSFYAKHSKSDQRRKSVITNNNQCQCPCVFYTSKSEGANSFTYRHEQNILWKTKKKTKIMNKKVIRRANQAIMHLNSCVFCHLSTSSAFIIFCFALFLVVLFTLSPRFICADWVCVCLHLHICIWNEIVCAFALWMERRLCMVTT